MKKSAYLINIARGGVVDEEPLSPNSKLWDLPNVILTPHIAARSPYYNDRCNKVTIDNLLRFQRDEELLFETDKKPRN